MKEVDCCYSCKQRRGFKCLKDLDINIKMNNICEKFEKKYRWTRGFEKK